MGDRRRQFYTKQLAQLEEELDAVEFDLKTAATERDRLRLDKEAEGLLKRIDELEKRLAECDAASETPAVRSRIFDKVVQQIDFKEAKRITELVKQKLNQEGGAVLFFLQKTQKQMGHLCIEEIFQLLVGNRIVDGEVIGGRRYSIDLASGISQFDEVEFLKRLASHLDIDESGGVDALLEQIRTTIRDSANQGNTIILLEIKGLDDLLEKANFLDWFIQDFWKPLIQEWSGISRQFKSKFIVTLSADSEILDRESPDYPATYFCDVNDYDCFKMLDLPLPNWSKSDIYNWFIDFRNLSPVLQAEDADALEQRAYRIFRASDGTPQNVCINLQELFR